VSDVATKSITALSDAFRNRDIEAALACFADDPGTTYAGSEQGEIAVGPEALRELLKRIFDRDESYSWTTDHLWESQQDDVHTVMAELTGTVHFNSGDSSPFPYRLSGVVRVENDAGRWLLLHGAEPTTRTSPAAGDEDRAGGARGAKDAALP
jgi:ketosteroid isomerase-like protein